MSDEAIKARLVAAREALGMLERTGDGIVSVTRKGLAWWRQVRP